MRATTAILFLTASAFATGACDADRFGRASTANNDTAKFFEEAASANKLEIESGRLAAQQAANPQLKAFAEQMVDDHTKADQDLQALAARKGVTLPAAMTDSHQKKLDALRKEQPGEEFDQEFRDLMIDSHEEAVSLFEDTADDARDPEVKSFAAKMLPTLQHHEREAKALPKA